MLSEDTIIRTPTGDRTISSLQPLDQVFDSHNHVINVNVGAAQPLSNPHRIVFRAYDWSHNMYDTDGALSTVTVDEEHHLHLVAAKYVASNLARNRRHPEFRTIVNWHTLCIGYISPEAQAQAELAELADLDPVAHPATYFRPRPAPVATTHASNSSHADAPSSDPSYAPSSDTDEDIEAADVDDGLRDDEEGIIDENDDDGESDEDEPIQPAPSSDAFLQDDAYPPHHVNRAQMRLADDEACQCGASRQFSLSCGNEAQARHLRMALRTPELAWRIDSKALLPGDPHTVPLPQFMESPHVKNPDRGNPPEGAFLKLARFPFETLSIRGTPEESLPIEAQWLGFWLGDGYHMGTSISSSDFDEMREYLSSYVVRLNAVRPEGAAPLHLHIQPKIFPEDHDGLHMNVTVFDFAITSTFRDEPGFYWNPIRSALQDLRIFGNYKERGIPDLYMGASQEARAALLAGLLDTDGCLVSSTSYEFSQSVKHEQLLRDTRRLAQGLGIKAGRIANHWTEDPNRPGVYNESLRFGLYGPALALVQPYMLLRRKRVRGGFYDNHLRCIAVQPFEAGRPELGRRITCAGRDVTLVQQQDGYILRGD